MADDVLTLGPVVFTGFATPEQLPLGGRQSMAVHKLLGGQRVIDTLGPDDADRTWTGFFWGPGALDQALLLDSLRVAGKPLPYSWAGESRTVVISEFTSETHRLNYVSYSITVVLADTGSAGDLGASSTSVDDLVAADFASAAAVPNAPSANVATVTALSTSLAASVPLVSAAQAAVMALQSNAGGAVSSLDLAVPALAASIDNVLPAGTPSAIAASVSALVSAVDQQSALVDMRGFLGRAVDNLAQTGV